jgi:hypothetical protein
VRVYQQPTSFKIHLRKGCGVSSRTRYGHSEIEMTEAELTEASDRKCQKCWKVSDGGANPITPTAAQMSYPVGAEPRERQTHHGVGHGSAKPITPTPTQFDCTSCGLTHGEPGCD